MQTKNDMLTVMNRQGKTDNIQLRVTPELKQKLQELANKDNLTISRLLFITVAKQYPELLDDILKN